MKNMAFKKERELIFREVKNKTEGLEQHSIALCEQVTALNFDRIIEHMGKVDEETLGRITEGVQVQVGVFDRYN